MRPEVTPRGRFAFRGRRMSMFSILSGSTVVPPGAVTCAPVFHMDGASAHARFYDRDGNAIGDRADERLDNRIKHFPVQAGTVCKAQLFYLRNLKR